MFSLGGYQGGQGLMFGMPYQPGSLFDRIVEGYAGPHDFLNSWGYDAFGNLQNHVGFERVLGATLNPLNVVLATPIVVPSALPRITYPGPGIVYGLRKPSSGDK